MNGDETRDDYTPEDESPPKEFYLTLGYAFGLLLLLVVLQLWMETLLSRGARMENTTWEYIALRNGVSGILTIQAGALLTGFTVFGLLEWQRFRWTTLIPVTLCVGGVVILASELGNLLQSIEPVSKEYVELLQKLTTRSFAGFIFVIAVVAPVTEEWLFRGVILEGLRARYQQVAAVLASTILFALAHIDPWMMINAFFIGLFLAWLKIRTGSLAPCLFAHALYNALPFLILRDLPVKIQGFNPAPGETIHFQPLWFDLLGVALLVAGGVLLTRMSQEESE